MITLQCDLTFYEAWTVLTTLRHGSDNRFAMADIPKAFHFDLMLFQIREMPGPTDPAYVKAHIFNAWMYKIKYFGLSYHVQFKIDNSYAA